MAANSAGLSTHSCEHPSQKSALLVLGVEVFQVRLKGEKPESLLSVVTLTVVNFLHVRL